MFMFCSYYSDWKLNADIKAKRIIRLYKFNK